VLVRFVAPALVAGLVFAAVPTWAGGIDESMRGDGESISGDAELVDWLSEDVDPLPGRLGIIPPDDATATGELVCPDGETEPGPTFARVVDTQTSGLRVRSGPGNEFPTHLILRNGARVKIVDGPQRDGQQGPWYQIASISGQLVHGWSNGEYLSMLDPCEEDQEPSAPEPSMILGRVLSARITAYTYQEPVGGAHGWITYSGLPVRWGIVAVDPGVIPLGSRLAIEGFRDLFLAADTGFGVIGHHVDIFFPDEETAVQFGVQYREVVVLN